MRATKAGVDHEMTTKVKPAGQSQSLVTTNGTYVGWLHTSGGIDKEHIKSPTRYTLETTGK